MTLVDKALRSWRHMDDQQRLLAVLLTGVALYLVLTTVKGWLRRWRNWRTRRRFEATQRKKWEGHKPGQIGARYRLKDKWLEKIGYPKRKRQ